MLSVYSAVIVLVNHLSFCLETVIQMHLILGLFYYNWRVLFRLSLVADGLDWVIGLDLFSFTFEKFSVTNYKRHKKVLTIKNKLVLMS